MSQKWSKIFFSVPLVFSLFAGSISFAVDDQAPKKVRYKKGKQLDFDSRSVQGDLRRPDVAPVIGDESNKNNGILRLRENFLDKMAVTAAGDIE